MRHLKEIIQRLRAVHADATTEYEPELENLRAEYADLEGQAVPLTLYEATYVYRDGRMVEGEVQPVKVTRIGVSPEIGATAPSIDFVRADGQKARGSVSQFYERKEWAQREVDFHLDSARQERALDELNKLVLGYLPVLLDAAERNA